MATIHVIRAEDGEVLTAMPALTALYDVTGMGWLFKLAKLPVLSGAAEIAYKMVSKNRQSMGAAADGLLALGRINMEEKGEGSCTDLEGECREKPPPVDEEAEAAEAAAVERRAKLAAEKSAAAEAKAKVAKKPVSTSAGGLENATRQPPPPSSGSLSDRRNILGVYDQRRSKVSARALRAAPVDTLTGELIDEVITIPLDDAELNTVANAVTSIVKHFGWQGNIGIGLPAQEVKTDAESVSETIDETLDSMDQLIDKSFHESMYSMEDGLPAKKVAERDEKEKNAPANWGKSRIRAMEKYNNRSMATVAAEVSSSSDSRKSRLEMEAYLKNAVGRDVVVMTGAEATGYGELQYGAGEVAEGITVCVTLGKTIGVSLFDNGILAHNPQDVTRQVATWDYPRWDDAPLPRPVLEEGDVEPLDEEWARWAARVEHYLSRIEAVCKPDNFIICGRASVSYDKWAPKMTKVKTSLRCAKQGLNAGVEGAAKGASEILTLRRDTARVRAAIGHRQGLSPQKLTDAQLEAVFDEFDYDNSGALSQAELATAINRLGVKMTEAELKELFVEMDSGMTGDIRKYEFFNWWKDSIGSSSVEIIHTMDEYKQVLDDADGTDQMTVLMVGVTYCKPCKAFTKKYQAFAERFSGARFIKVFGNENKDMTVLCRDELKVKSTPTFYFFRNTEQVHMHTGANPGKFEKAMLENLREGEVGYGSERQFEDPVEDPKKKSVGAAR